MHRDDMSHQVCTHQAPLPRTPGKARDTLPLCVLQEEGARFCKAVDLTEPRSAPLGCCPAQRTNAHPKYDRQPPALTAALQTWLSAFQADWDGNETTQQLHAHISQRQVQQLCQTLLAKKQRLKATKDEVGMGLHGGVLGGGALCCGRHRKFVLIFAWKESQFCVSLLRVLVDRESGSPYVSLQRLP